MAAEGARRAAGLQLRHKAPDGRRRPERMVMRPPTSGHIAELALAGSVQHWTPSATRSRMRLHNGAEVRTCRFLSRCAQMWRH
jgi:hypothetical protein